MTSPRPSALSQDAAHGRPGSVTSLLSAAGAYPLAENRCRSCREILCSCPDAVFAGVAPAIDHSVHEEREQQGASVRDPAILRGCLPAGMVDQFHAHLQPLDESRNHGA